MIDLITLVKNKVPESEILEIVDRAELQECTRNGTIYYETSLQQKNREHMFIRVGTNEKMKIECSLHKLYEKTQSGHYTNYGLFTLDQAKQTIIETLPAKGIDLKDIRIYNYEIGLNLYMSQDCRAYLDKVETIGPYDDRKPLFVNPRYKDCRVKTTVFHRHIRKHFKLYDKGFEARDKRRDDVPDQNILRLETVFRRVENMGIDEFFSLENIVKMQDRFFRDWRTLQFDKDIEVPKGTRLAKKELCKTILDIGTIRALDQTRDQYKQGIITEKQFRIIREFIEHEWNTFKNGVRFIQSPEEIEYRERLNQAKTLLLK